MRGNTSRFGPAPERDRQRKRRLTAPALELLDQGKTRQEIIEATGKVVGVHNANLEVNEGEICVLMGLSGSGKSSLLRAVNGLNPISRGSLEVRC